MKAFEDFKIKFEKPDWSRNPEFALIDTILEKHPHLVALLAQDIVKRSTKSLSLKIIRSWFWVI